MSGLVGASLTSGQDDDAMAAAIAASMAEATAMLDAERSTLFINDEKTNELFSHVGEGLESMEIRLPNTAGIAGSVFTSGEAINIPHAYTDLRFNPAFDTPNPRIKRPSDISCSVAAPETVASGSRP